MGALDVRVAAVLDELAPPRPQRDGWEAIVAAATPERGRRRLLVALVPLVAAAAAVLGLVLAWPFGGGSGGTILERAEAAIGDGPVLHVVIRSGWGGTLIDLATGERTPMHGEEELWYDPSHGIRQVSRFGGVEQSEAVYPPGRVRFLDNTLAGLATGYREALRDGTARVLGPGVLDGEPVYWIRVDTQMLPDVADGNDHAWAHDVAVSQSSFEPVGTRETRDGKTGPDGASTIVSVETLPAGSADFMPAASPSGGAIRIQGRVGPGITLDQAEASLGRPVLWAGPSVAGLDLARIGSPAVSEREEPTGTWKDAPATVTLFYGRLDDRLGLGIGPAGLVKTPFVQISQTATLYPSFQRGVRDYSPPEGSMLVFGGRIGVMQADGLHLALEASSEDVLLAAARALERAP